MVSLRDFRREDGGGVSSSNMALGGRQDRIMTWCSALNIYKVNRFHMMDADLNSKRRKTRKEDPSTVDDYKVDILVGLLNHNMVEQAEYIFDLVGLRTTWACRQVSSVWNDFITNHIFKRWAFQMARHDPLLCQDLTQHLKIVNSNVSSGTAAAPINDLYFGNVCRNLHCLRDRWRTNSPKNYRVNCESFVLSVVITKSPKTFKPFLYCGLNNGDLQLWAINSENSNLFSKLREMEVHRKGVKCLGVEGHVLVTGSYDCTCKVWSRTDWSLLHTVTLHTDSVWEIKLKQRLFGVKETEESLKIPTYTFATAGLDGAVGFFYLRVETGDRITLEQSNVLHAHDDLVAAVDFTEEFMVTGHEDSTVGVWDVKTRPMRSIRVLPGHSGGVTGVVINGPVLASASYDGSVRLWSLKNFTCLHIFNEPTSLVRCLSFVGPTLACGDFSGAIHIWELSVMQSSAGKVDVRVTHHNTNQAHKGHVVCLMVTPTKVVSGSRDKTVLVQDFWMKDSDFSVASSKAEEEELTREQQRMLRRKAVLQRGNVPSGRY